MGQHAAGLRITLSGENTMRIRRLNTGAAAVIAACLLWVAGCKRDIPNPPPSAEPAAPATLPAVAAKPSSTIVTAHLEEKIPLGKNVLWCATFQLAWNELMDYAGGPLTIDNSPVMVDILNRRSFISADIDAESYVALAGRISDGTLDKARKELTRKFPGQSTDLLPIAATFPPDAVMMYAFLAKHLPFEYAFPRQDSICFLPDGEPAEVPVSNIAAFGFSQYSPSRESEVKQARQVRILWHEFAKTETEKAEHFVVELLTRSKEDRLILARIPPKETLGATVSEVMRLSAKPNTLELPSEDRAKLKALVEMLPETESQYACLLPMECLYVPLVDLDVCREYVELHGLSCRNPKLERLPWAFAMQQIQFRLDEGGAALKSEALGGLFGDAGRNFYFGRPFLILLLRRGASRPYFALWIGNSDLLVKAPQRGGK